MKVLVHAVEGKVLLPMLSLPLSLLEAGHSPLEQFIDTLISLNPIWIYVAAALIAYIENIFPPFPSDVVLVAAGYLCATGRVELWVVLVVSTVGSAAGFVTMYKIGSWFGLKVLEAKRFKFLELEKIHKVEAWFKKYGYLVVVVNRFLAGTRAVIAFFAGISNLSFWKTTCLALFSSLMWNAILLFSGKAVGANWRAIAPYLDLYGKIVIALSLLVLLVIVGHGYFKKRNQS
jgi:membrane protein DedA with SNARE-associated domain